MNLFLRKSLVCMVALFSGSAFAASFNNPFACPHFYVGGTLGIATLTDKESTYNPIRDAHSLGASDAIGGVLAGIAFDTNMPVKFGLEAFINATDLEARDNQNYAPITSFKAKMRYNTGLRILPAYEFTPGTEAHIILGYSYGNFNVSDNGNYGIIHQTFSSNGFQAGLGIEAILIKHFLIRTDAIYTTYSSHTANGITTSIPSSTQSYHNRPSTLEGDLTLIYKI